MPIKRYELTVVSEDRATLEQLAQILESVKTALANSTRASITVSTSGRPLAGTPPKMGVTVREEPSCQIVITPKDPEHLVDLTAFLQLHKVDYRIDGKMDLPA